MNSCSRFSSLGAFVFAGSAPVAWAQTTDHQIPYQGRLELDGVAISGSYDFWFELYPTPTGGDCQAAPSVDCLWTDELTGVEVVGGSFSVVLGSSANPLGDVIWQNAEVYLGIRVAAPGDGYTQLTGRQRILAVPMAARAETAKNYHVTGMLQVDGGVTVSGGDLVNTSADAQLAVSRDFALRDTGDTWLRLRAGAGSAAYADLAVGQLFAGGNLDIGLEVVNCLSAASTNGCYCPAGKFPIDWTITCVNVGHAMYGARYVTNSAAGTYGVKGQCYHTNGNVYLVNSILILCGRVQPPATIPESSPWNF